MFWGCDTHKNTVRTFYDDFVEIGFGNFSTPIFGGQGIVPPYDEHGACGSENCREVVRKRVSEAGGRIKTLWERSMMIFGKLIFEDFSTPEIFRIREILTLV